MNRLAATREWLYSVHDNTVRIHSVETPHNARALSPPGVAPHKVMASVQYLYALDADGYCARRWHESSGWEPIATPVGTTQMTADGENIYALAGDEVFVRHESVGSNWSRIPRLALFNAVQIDHDEINLWSLDSSSGLRHARTGESGWAAYPVPLGGVVEITAGILYVYARDNSGRIWRSKDFGKSGWSLMVGDDMMVGMAISIPHDDRLWCIDDAGNITARDARNWVAPHQPPVDVADGWVNSDWVSDDWVEVA